MLQYVDERFEYVIEIALETGKTDGGGVRASARLDLGCAYFQEVIELVAGLRLRAAGSPDFAVDVDQADLARGLIDRSAANARSSADHGQLMIFLQEDDHAVRKFDAFGLLRLERGQRTNRNLLPAGSLGQYLCRGDE